MSLPIVRRALQSRDRIALVAPEGVFTYADLLRSSARVSEHLLGDRRDLDGSRVGFLVTPGFDHVAVQWGIWRAGGIAVPLAVSHPPPELRYVLEDTGAETVVTHPGFADRIGAIARDLGIPVRRTAQLLEESDGGEAERDPATPGTPPTTEAGLSAAGLPHVGSERAAMILYTSGTTGRPKGVVITHDNIRAQVESLVAAWGWTEQDHILLHLPLHHVHGIVNALTCALWSGGCCQILDRFDAHEVWERIGQGDLTLYMAVPTVYRRLIDAWDDADAKDRRRWSESARGLRLMVSGSAALPVSTLERWEAITGQRLLERYGMTEIGMALSNPLEGERRPGQVGSALPGVEVRLVDGEDRPVPEAIPGRIQVRGPNVFREYWERPEATAEAFTSDGWFRTGDEAVVQDGVYRILGRSSVDILKSGGEKVSALEIEDVLRQHEAVADCAVVGVADPEWGERVCAAVIPTGSASASDPDELISFVKKRLAPYKVPKDLLFVDDLPRNAMGKVTKPDVRTLFETRETP